MSDFSHIGLRIKQLRKTLDVSQQEFVDGLDISRAALSQIEGNIINLSLELLTKIVSKYNISADWVISGQGNMFLDNLDATKPQDKNDIKRNVYPINNDFNPTAKDDNQLYNKKLKEACTVCQEKDKRIEDFIEQIMRLDRIINTLSGNISGHEQKRKTG